MTPLVASAPLHAAAAALCLLWAALVMLAGRGGRAAVLPALLCLAAALWAAVVAAGPLAPISGLAALADLLRNALALALLSSLDRRLSGGPVQSRRLAWLGAALLGAGLLVQLAAVAGVAGIGPWATLAQVSLALLLVVLAENVARNADEAARWHANLPCIAVGGLAAFDLVLHAEAALTSGFSAQMLNARGALWGLAPALLVLAALRDRRWRRAPAVSRQAVFHGATLVIAGAFLLGVGVAGEALRWLDADWGGTARAGLIAGALMALAVALSSRSFRSRIRRGVVDHFFAARYDYRAEWMRCAATLSAADDEVPAARRAIRAVADAVDVPAGLLLLHAEAGGGLQAAGHWNLPAPPAPLPPLPLDGKAVRPLAGLPAPWGALWLAVPLVHHREGLLGAVLLARPRAPFPLDEEVEALLLALGREVAMFLAERQAAERLADSRRLADYAKRFAFVAHDVKTVSNQLSLMLANAEAHLDDPEFQRDLLTTMRASAARINTLIARLRQEEAAVAAPPLAVVERLRALARGRARPVEVEQEGGVLPPAIIPPENFDAAVTHLLNNAAEASPPEAPVRVVVRPAEGALEVDIIDHGPGMTSDFIRDELFRPLATSKPGGSGIGAWQARELLRQAGGSVSVLSRPGAGTTMRLRLPVAAA
ncbi:ATP-binding protein [Roseococcus sp. DSY-14]|uniref:ATP-binding protein n=1 Tax=Roseococcus sp. DSY-14 TaxID=3369650 RepID=UPI00387A9149